MKTNKGIIQLIENANEDDLREIVSGWIEGHPDFEMYIENCLYPPVENVDFERKLSQAINCETKEFFSRHEVREATDWGNVFVDLIKPWSENADSMSIEKLYDLIDVIVREVGMRIEDNDFYGDDWYGDDFSGDIQDIMDTLGNLVGILLVRDDLDRDTLELLKELITQAKKKDIIDNYIRSNYEFILELVKIRKKADEVTCALFDMMIYEDLGDKAGEWVCRKIDFIRSVGLTDEAQKLMEGSLKYAEVCLKYYEELIAQGRWQDALNLIDKAYGLEKGHESHFCLYQPNWLKMKQQLLIEHGTTEERIENLKQLFHRSLADKSTYYHQLKELVDPRDWNDFYHKLLSEEEGNDYIDKIAPFLIEENEYDWLFRLVSDRVEKVPTDYLTPLKYAGVLRETHFEEMEAILLRTIQANAACRFPRKKKVDSSEYPYFRDDLESLSDRGYSKIQKEIVEFLLQEYRFRPALYSELRSIKLSTDNSRQ